VLLDENGLRKKIIAYVKDERENLNAMRIAINLWLVVRLWVWKKVFRVIVFAISFFKTCQYVTTEKKVHEIFKCLSIQVIESNLQKCIMWPNFFGKGRLGWNKVCIDYGICPRKLNFC
jgi:hypothetical protein